MASDQPHGLEGPEDGQEAVQGHVRTEGDGMAVIRHDEAEYEDGVRCVVMPCCAFTFDASHTDDGSDPPTYTCPLGHPPAVVEALHEIERMAVARADDPDNRHVALITAIHAIARDATRGQ